MFAHPAWQRFALLCNLAGSVLIFLAFQATSSDLRLLTNEDGRVAMCVNQVGLMVAIPPSKGNLGGMDMGVACPDWKKARPTALVNSDKPMFAWVGGGLTVVGFSFQFLAFPSSRTIAQIRKELKEAKVKEKIQKTP